MSTKPSLRPDGTPCDQQLYFLVRSWFPTHIRVSRQALKCTFHAVLPLRPNLERVLRPEVALAALGPLVGRVAVVHDAVAGLTWESSSNLESTNIDNFLVNSLGFRHGCQMAIARFLDIS